MKLKSFLENHEVEYTRNVVKPEEVSVIEKEMGVSLGHELSEYILKYGYLAYKHLEYYGINSVQMLESDMVRQTKYIHTYFPKTINYIAFSNSGDGYYILVSSQDDVYEYSCEMNVVYDLGMKLFDYILESFQEIDK